MKFACFTSLERLFAIIFLLFAFQARFECISKKVEEEEEKEMSHEQHETMNLNDGRRLIIQMTLSCYSFVQKLQPRNEIVLFILFYI